MIRLHRGAEPPALAKARDGAGGELARVRVLASPSSDDIDDKYRCVAEDLWRAQQFKCAYCEGQEQKKRNDVEHFRPKARIDPCDGKAFIPGYWWLAWSWSNLLFSCRNCNQSPAKVDKFPIEAGSKRLVAEEEPPGAEMPLILDPYIDEPMNHLVFKRARFGLRERWGPIPLTTRGKRTIEILLLDRDDLLDLYEKHVEDHIRPGIDHLHEAIALGNPAMVQSAWRHVARVTERGRPFSALAYDALDALVPESLRQTWTLSLSRP